MHSTVGICGGSGCAGEEDPLSFLTNPTASRSIMQKQKKTQIQKQKKRETDRRYRQNKKKTMTETKNKLTTTIIENENLKSTVKKLQQEIVKLTKQLKSIESSPETTYAELRQEVQYLRIENEMAKCLLKDPKDIILSNMITVLREMRN